MRKTLYAAVFLMTALVILGGCKKEDALSPELMEGFALYEDTGKGISFQYPERWTLVNNPEAAKEAAKALENCKKKVITDLMLVIKDMDEEYFSNNLILLDLEAMSGERLMYVFMDHTYEAGVTDKSHTTAMIMHQFNKNFTEYYPEYFADYTFLEEPSKAVIGGKEFLRVSFSYTDSAGDTMVQYQSFIAAKNYYHGLALEACEDEYNAQYEDFMTMLGSLTFAK